MRNTIRKVTMVVAVLMTNCHVSLKRNMGPVATQMRMMSTAMKKAAGCPAVRAVRLARRLNTDATYIGFLRSHSTDKFDRIQQDPILGCGMCSAKPAGQLGRALAR